MSCTAGYPSLGSGCRRDGVGHLDIERRGVWAARGELAGTFERCNRLPPSQVDIQHLPHPLRAIPAFFP